MHVVCFVADLDCVYNCGRHDHCYFHADYCAFPPLLAIILNKPTQLHQAKSSAHFGETRDKISRLFQLTSPDRLPDCHFSHTDCTTLCVRAMLRQGHTTISMLELYSQDNVWVVILSHIEHQYNDGSTHLSSNPKRSKLRITSSGGALYILLSSCATPTRLIPFPHSLAELLHCHMSKCAATLVE